MTIHCVGQQQLSDVKADCIKDVRDSKYFDTEVKIDKANPLVLKVIYKFDSVILAKKFFDDISEISEAANAVYDPNGFVEPEKSHRVKDFMIKRADLIEKKKMQMLKKPIATMSKMVRVFLAKEYGRTRGNHQNKHSTIKLIFTNKGFVC